MRVGVSLIVICREIQGIELGMTLGKWKPAKRIFGSMKDIFLSFYWISVLLVLQLDTVGIHRLSRDDNQCSRIRVSQNKQLNGHIHVLTHQWMWKYCGST